MEKFKHRLGQLYRFSNSWTGTVIIVLLVIFFFVQAFVIPSGSMKKTLLIGDHLFVKKFTYGIPTPHLPWLEVPVLPDFDGDGHLLRGEGPKRGEIVVFRYPPNEAIHYVKRCVATGGDELFYTPDALYLHPSQGNEYVRANYGEKNIVEIDNKLWVKNPYMQSFPNIHYTSKEEGHSAFEMMAQAFLRDQSDMQPVYVEAFKDRGGPFNAFYKKIKKDRYYMVGDNRDNSNDSRFWGSVGYKHIVGKPWFIYFSWDEDYTIRWDRIGSGIDSLQLKPYERN
ncbi:MAG: signal peptidase I [Campylobacterota bacterium]